MAQAIGWGALPIGVSLRGLQQQIDKELKAPMEKAAKQVAESTAKRLQDAASVAEKAVLESTKKQEKAVAAVEQAEKALARQREIQAEKVKAVEAAEENLKRVRSDSGARVEKAEKNLAKLRADEKASVDDIAEAERRLESARSAASSQVISKETALAKARRSAEDAADAVAKAEGTLADKQNAAGEAADNLVAKTKQLEDAQKAAERASTGLSGAMTSVKDSAASTAGAIGDFAEKYSTQAKVAVGAIGGLAAASVSYAAEAEQSYGAVESIFHEHADVINQASKSASEAVGMSGRAYREQSAYIGAMLKNNGVPLEDLAGKSQDLVKLGADLSATYGGSVQEAVEAIGATLRGETDPIERFGVSIKQADINARLAAKGLDKLDGEAGKQAKTQELLALLYEQTADAQGQFGREHETAANVMQRFKASLDDVREEIGNYLLPYMQQAADMARVLANAVKENPEPFLAAAAAISAFAGAIVGINVIGATVRNLQELAGIGKQMTLLFNPWVAGIAAVVGGLTLFFTKTETGRKLWADFTEAFSERWDQAVGRFQDGLDKVLGFLSRAKDFALEVKGILFDGDFTGQANLFGLGDESSRVVDFLFDVRETALQVYNLLFKGDFVGGGGLFGLDDESSLAVDLLLTLRDTVISIGDSLKSAFGSAKDIVLDLGQALGSAVWDVLKGIFGLLQDLWPVFEVVGKVIGGVLVVAFMAAVKAVQLFFGALSGVMSALAWLTEKALAPFLSFVGSFVGAFLNDIVPVLTWFAGLIGTVVGGAFSLLGTVISGTWNNVIEPTFSALVTVGKWMVQILGTVVISPILIAWNLMSEGIQWAWENRIKPTFEFLAAAGTWLWQNALLPAFDGIKWAFEQMGDGLQWVYDNVLKPVFDGFVWLAQQAWNGAVIVFDGIKWAFQALGDGLRWVNDNIIQPVWDAFGAGLTWLHDNVVAPVTGWIGDKWSRMGDGMNAVKGFVVDTVFGGLQRGLDTLRGWFQVAVDAITRIWDGIKAAAARPVRFVVDTVFNNGIRPAWNAVAKFTGLDELQPVGLGDLGAYATGGVLPGYTPGRDPYTFVEPRTGMSIGLSGGEAILRPEVTRALGVDHVDGLNSAARMGGVSAVQRYLGGFASGGVIGSISDAVRRFFPMMTITSTLRPGDPGWHGQGKAVDFSNSTDSTPQMRAAAEWFYANYGPGLLELIHSPFNNNVKNGQNVGDGFGFYGAGTMNGHRNHVHVAAPAPLGDPSVMVEMLEDAGSSAGFSLGAMVKSMWDKAIGKIGSWSGPGLIGKLPGAMLGKLAEAAWNTIKSAAEKAAAMFGGAGGSAGNAESWREMAMWAMRREGFNADDPAQVNAMLAQIMSESGGNPGIAQQIVDVNGTGESAGVGLLQIIPGTFAAYRDPSLPDDRRDPEANMVAALRYYKARYGTDLTTTWGHGHGYASGGVLPGFTPGVDVHQFYSPTAGWLGLSGGESIMVPEWTAMQGGPAAVERMNRAARAGRSSSARGGQAFADGGVFGSARGGFDAAVASLQAAADEIQSAFAGNDQGYDALAATLRNEQWAKAIVDGAAMLGKIADYSSVEGVAARSFASEMAEIAGMLGGKTISTVTSSLLDAEKQIWDARAGSADRLAAVAEKEKALAEARRAAADAASAEMSEESKKRIADAEEALAKAREDGNADKVAEAEKKLADTRKETSEKSAEDVTKANEQVVKAEQELSAARKAAAQALDIPIHTIAPQISGMLTMASAATVSIPPLSAALAGLAAVVGPAGITVGVVLESLKAALSAAQKIATAIDALVGRVMKARVVAFDGLSQMYEGVRGLSELARQFRQDVTSATFAQAMAVIALADAQRNQRIVAMQGMQAQLDGALKVAEAERNLRESRERDARAQRLLNRDLTESWGGLRHAILQATLDSVEATAYKSQETLAWEAKLSAAELDLQILQAQGASANLKAQYDATVAAFDLRDATRDLGVAAEKLALMTGETFGTTEVEATVGKRWSDLQAEKAELQAWKAELGTWVNPANWGAMRDADRRIAQIDAELADLESREQFTMDAETQREIERVVKRAGMMGLFGAGDNVARRLKNSALGDASRALERIQWESALIDLEAATDAAKLRDDYDRQRAELDFTKQSKPLEVEVAGLEMMRDSFLTTAQYYEADNDARSRQLLEQLARTQMAHGQEIVNLSRGDSKVVQMPDEKRSYTAEEVEWMLGELDVRVEKLERPQPSAAMVAAYQRAGY